MNDSVAVGRREGVKWNYGSEWPSVYSFTQLASTTVILFIQLTRHILTINNQSEGGRKAQWFRQINENKFSCDFSDIKIFG